MNGLLTFLNQSLEGTALAGLAAAFAWGVLSVVLSPCHLAGIPLMLAAVGQGRVQTLRWAFAAATLFSAGVLLTVVGIGAATLLAGRIAGDIGPWGNILAAAIFLLVGLHLLDVLPAPWTAPSVASFQGRGLSAVFVLGLVFGLALGPCTFAYMAAVLAVAIREANTNLPYAATVLGLYALGHCGALAAAGTSLSLAQRALDWGDRGGRGALLRQGCGVLVILAGLYFVYSIP